MIFSEIDIIDNLRREPNELSKYFCSRFKKSYNVILADVKPLPGAAKLHYDDAFNSEFTLLLRERRPISLEDMMDDATKVEVNLSASNKNK
jgi:hypothetical protein